MDPHCERRRNALHAVWVKLDRQKATAEIIMLCGAGPFLVNLSGGSGPSFDTLGTTGLPLLAGGFWLWQIRRNSRRLARLTLQQTQATERAP